MGSLLHYSTIHNYKCKVVEVQTSWCLMVYRACLPNHNEVVRVYFKKTWKKREHATIVAVAEKIPNNVLEEDPKLLKWYDQAVTRIGVV